VFAKEGKFLAESDDRPAGLVLFDGTIHNEDRRTKAYRMGSFREMEFRLPRENVEEGRRVAPRNLSLPELSRKISETRGTGLAATYRFHFHRRISLAVSCLAFGLLAIPLGLSQRARGKSPAIALTLVVILVYYLFLAAAGSLTSHSPLLMGVLLWFPNAAGFATACWFLWRSENRMIVLPDPIGRLARKR
jgi:lipopolysaccharide export LptBFGC system permease protein LptF